MPSSERRRGEEEECVLVRTGKKRTGDRVVREFKEKKGLAHPLARGEGGGGDTLRSKKKKNRRVLPVFCFARREKNLHVREKEKKEGPVLVLFESLMGRTIFPSRRVSEKKTSEGRKEKRRENPS